MCPRGEHCNGVDLRPASVVSKRDKPPWASQGGHMKLHTPILFQHFIVRNITNATVDSLSFFSFTFTSISKVKVASTLTG
eukprot:UN3491